MGGDRHRGGQSPKSLRWFEVYSHLVTGAGLISPLAPGDKRLQAVPPASGLTMQEQRQKLSGCLGSASLPSAGCPLGPADRHIIETPGSRQNQTQLSVGLQGRSHGQQRALSPMLGTQFP